MLATFTLNRDESLQRYHLRCNVKSTRSMVRARFGRAVRNMTDGPCQSEVLAKVLCNNIVVVIYEMHELGIAPESADGPRPAAEL